MGTLWVLCCACLSLTRARGAGGLAVCLAQLGDTGGDRYGDSAWRSGEALPGLGFPNASAPSMGRLRRG